MHEPAHRREPSLRIAYLNAWGLNCGKDLLDYLADLAADGVQAFCLTETWDHDSAPTGAHAWRTGVRSFPAAHRAVADLLGGGYRGAFACNSVQDLRCDRTGTVFTGVRQGNSLFVARGLQTIASGDLEVFPAGFPRPRPRPVAPRRLQYVAVRAGGSTLLILNFHGIWIAGEGKGGCPEHVWQSQVLVRRMSALAASVRADALVLGADLNLDVEAAELAELERWSMPGTGRPLRNLVRSAGLASTRTPLFALHGEPGISAVSDHLLCSLPRTAVRRLQVGAPHVSDHLPLLLDLAIGAG